VAPGAVAGGGSATGCDAGAVALGAVAGAVAGEDDGGGCISSSDTETTMAGSMQRSSAQQRTE